MTRLPELAITTRSQVAIEAIHRFGGELLSHGCGAGAILEGVAADPDCALAQAYAAVLLLSRMTREGRVQAAPRLRAAETLAAHATPRERQIVAAIVSWGTGDDRRAARLLASVVETWPRDLISAKLAQIVQLGIGDVVGMRRTAAYAAAAEPDSGFAPGLLAFALEQAGDLDRAEAYGRRAIARNPVHDPWAQHAIAHVLTAREDVVAGRAFLRANAPSWDRCSSFMLTHNWWHAALFALRLGDEGGALALFDGRIWGVRKDHPQDQVNAISLLARLELKGVAVGDRWDDLARHSAPRADDGVSTFLDLHYLYALARAGADAAADALADLVAHRCGAPAGLLAEGVVAHARGAWYRAAVALGQARRRLGEIGGSQMQRELFERLFVDSLLRAGGDTGSRVRA